MDGKCERTTENGVQSLFLLECSDERMECDWIFNESSLLNLSSATVTDGWFTRGP